MADFLTDKPTNLQRAFLVGVQTPDMADGEAAELLGELKELVENLRIEVAQLELVNLRRPSPAYLLGHGKATTGASGCDAGLQWYTMTECSGTPSYASSYFL